MRVGEIELPVSDEATTCMAVEYRGDGPRMEHVSSESWDSVIKTFHEVKGGLLAWLDEHRAELPADTVSWMQNTVTGSRSAVSAIMSIRSRAARVA